MRKWLLIALVATLIGSVVAVVQTHLHRFEHQRDSYLGLRVNAFMDEAQYVMGYPGFVGEPVPDDPAQEWSSYLQTDGKDPTNKMQSGRTVRDYPEWSYKTAKNIVGLGFNLRMRRVTEISCHAVGLHKRSSACPRIFGVNIGDSEEAVISSLGPPDGQAIRNGVKTLSYGILGLELSLEKGAVYRLVKRAPEQSVGPAWLIMHQSAWVAS